MRRRGRHLPSLPLPTDAELTAYAAETIRRIGTKLATPRDWSHYDAFPPELRAYLQETVRAFDDGKIAGLYAQHLAHQRPDDAVFTTLRFMRAIEANDTLEFAERHRRRYGYDLPHRAAEATFQRYGRR